MFTHFRSLRFGFGYEVFGFYRGQIVLSTTNSGGLISYIEQNFNFVIKCSHYRKYLRGLRLPLCRTDILTRIFAISSSFDMMMSVL